MQALRALGRDVLRRGGSPERLGGDVLTSPSAEQVQNPVINDPLFPKIQEAINELSSLSFFRRTGDVVRRGGYFSLAGADLEQAKIINRFLPGFRDTQVLVEIGPIRRGYVSREGSYSGNRIIGPSIEIRLILPKGDELRHELEYSGLEISGVENNSDLGDPDSNRTVHFERKSFQGGRENLLGKKGANPVLAIDQLTGVVRDLRGEFAQREQERAEQLLNPAQRGLVKAIRNRGMKIWEDSGDDFVLTGYLGEDNRLSRMSLAFSSAGDEPNSNWTRKDSLDGLAVEWLERNRVLSALTHLFAVGIHDTGFAYETRGELTLERAERRRTLLLDRFKIEIAQLRTESRPWQSVEGVGDFVRYGFTDFLKERIDGESRYSKSLILATSIPII